MQFGSSVSVPGRRGKRLGFNSPLNWILLACTALAGSVCGQNQEVRVSITPRAAPKPSVKEAGTPWLRTDVNRVLIPVTVTDSSGRIVQGLGKEDFRLLEDGRERELSDFFRDDGPISIGVVLDASGSMKNKLADARRAVSAFIRLTPQDDEYFLVSLRDQPELVHGFTTNVEAIEADLEAIQPKGWTALYDAMYLAINHMKRASRNRRVLLVLSDGEDNNSRYSESEIRSLVREADVRIFSISIQSHTPALDKLAAESGGRAYPVHNLSEMPAVSAALSEEAHSEYVLGFAPSDNQRDGKFHIVKVELTSPSEGRSLHVSWRRGYYAALE